MYMFFLSKGSLYKILFFFSAAGIKHRVVTLKYLLVFYYGADVISFRIVESMVQ